MAMSLKELRKNPMYLNSIILHGNNKLLDYDDTTTDKKIRYAQFNTRAITDCPFKSKGCEKICYATKGNHVFPSVKNSREKSYNDSKKENFAECMIYTIETEQTTKRYKGNIMLMRIHESGDFYSIQYLRKWVKVWAHFTGKNGIHFTLYTKSFPFFLMLTKEEKETVNKAMESGILSINLSIDDTTSTEQKIAYLKCLVTFPKANTYICTEDVETVAHDEKCDCADCGKCGICNRAEGKRTAVIIHSASNNDMENYRKYAEQG